MAAVPAKLILFGEWAVLEGHPGIAIPLPTYFRAGISAVASGIHFHSKSPEGEEFLEWKNGEKPPVGYFKLAAETLRHLSSGNAHAKWNGTKFYFEREWKLSEGLGSSGALVLSLTRLEANREHKNYSLPELWHRARAVVRHGQGGGSGLDLAAQVFEKPVVLEQDEVRVIELNRPSLLLFHTGKKMSTPAEFKKTRDAKLIAQIAESTKSFLKDLDWEKAMVSHFNCLQALGVVPDFVAATQATWAKNKWISALKTTGAGGGDGILVLPVPGKEELLRTDAERRGWWPSKIFGFHS